MTARTKTWFGVVTIVLGIVVALFIGLVLGRLESIRAQAALRSDPIAVKAFNARLAKATNPVILLGDSRVAQWNPTPVIDGVPVSTVGVGGLTAEQLEYAIPFLKTDLRDHIVIVQIGINDLKSIGYTNITKDEITKRTLASIQKIATELAESGARVVITTVIPPGPVSLMRIPIWTSEINAATVEVNRQITEGLIDDADSIVDFTGVLGSPEQIDSRYAKDTLHINTEGYQELSERIEMALKQTVDADP